MPRFTMYGKLTAHPGKRDELVGVLLEAADLLGGNPECDLYIVNVVDDEPEAVWVTESWGSKDAHDRSLQDDRVRAIVQRGMPLIAGVAEQVHMRPVGGKGFAGPEV